MVKALLIIVLFAQVSCSSKTSKRVTEPLSDVTDLLTEPIVDITEEIIEPLKDDSEDTGHQDYVESLVSEAKVNWFDVPSEYRRVDANGEVMPHLFFDVNPGLTDEYNINFVPLVMAGHAEHFSLDLKSGQTFLARRACSISDLTKKSNQKIFYPPFTIGFIPRYLNQLGEMQKIIVFGDGDYYKKHSKKNFFEVKIIGGYVEHYCPRGRCANTLRELSSLVLIGIQENHPNFKNIENVRELKERVDWDEVEVFIQNGQGVNELSSSYHLWIRMGQLIDLNSTMDFFAKNTFYFSNKQLFELRKSCHRLYNLAYKDLGQFSITDSLKFATDDEEESQLRKEILNNYKAKNLEIPKEFYDRFKTFLINHGKNYLTCNKYVAAPSINKAKTKFNFFVYLNSVFHLIQLGHEYNCKSNSWEKNIKFQSSQIDFEKLFKHCNDHEVDNAFYTSVFYQKRLYFSSKPAYRFIDYDNSSYGSHRKIYSWVPYDGKVLRCNQRNRTGLERKVYSNFPSDIKWKFRTNKNQKSLDDGKLIY